MTWDDPSSRVSRGRPILTAKPCGHRFQEMVCAGLLAASSRRPHGAFFVLVDAVRYISFLSLKIVIEIISASAYRTNNAKFSLDTNVKQPVHNETQSDKCQLALDRCVVPQRIYSGYPRYARSPSRRGLSERIVLKSYRYLIFVQPCSLLANRVFCFPTKLTNEI